MGHRDGSFVPLWDIGTVLPFHLESTHIILHPAKTTQMIESMGKVKTSIC